MSEPIGIPIADFQTAEQVEPAGERLEAVRSAAVAFRARFVQGGMPERVRTCDLVTLPYPTRYAFWHAIRHPAPFLWFMNRMLVVIYRDHADRRRVLLFNPTDVARAAEVPFYKRLAVTLGPWMAYRVLSRRHGTVAEHLASLGIRPDEVDFLSFDHLHTQDLRGWLGPDGLFPQARLLVPRAEWRVYDRLHPLQAWWYIAAARDGVAAERVVVLDGDVSLGAGVALLATPGHTVGNQSLVLNTPAGVAVVSENGVSLDNYAPALSRLPGLAAYAATGQEVVLNGNTLEGSLAQYVSMIKELTVAGPHPLDPRFPYVFSSSELVAHPFAPGLRPTLATTRLSHG